MTYKRKTQDEWQLWINYGQGWQHEISEDSWKEMREQLKCYRENCPQYPVRAVKKRIKLEPEPSIYKGALLSDLMKKHGL